MSEEKKTSVNFNRFNIYVIVGSVMGSPNFSQSLGPKGIPQKLFSDECNKILKTYKPGMKVSLNVAYQKGGKFQILKIKSLSVPLLIKEKINLKTGSAKPGINILAEMSMKQAREIAEQKMNETTAFTLEGALKTVIGTARSMGVKVI